MTAQEIVASFVGMATRCLDALLETYEGSERPTVWTGLFLRPRDGGEPVRSGELEGLGSFRLHGRGCQFELAAGADIDVDWDDRGRATFDSWRILMYARSVGNRTVDQESLRVAAVESPLLSQIGADAFTWAEQRYDLTRDEA